jgi:hypothetical protein
MFETYFLVIDSLLKIFQPENSFIIKTKKLIKKYETYLL